MGESNLSPWQWADPAEASQEVVIVRGRDLSAEVVYRFDDLAIEQWQFPNAFPKPTAKLAAIRRAKCCGDPLANLDHVRDGIGGELSPKRRGFVIRHQVRLNAVLDA